MAQNAGGIKWLGSLGTFEYLPDIGIEVSFAGFGGRGGGVDRFLAILWYLPFYGTTILSNMLNFNFVFFVFVSVCFHAWFCLFCFVFLKSVGVDGRNVENENKSKHSRIEVKNEQENIRFFDRNKWNWKKKEQMNVSWIQLAIFHQIVRIDYFV